MKSVDDAPYLDLFSNEYRHDPIGVLGRVRAESGVVQTVAGPTVVRHDLVHALVKSRRLRSSPLQWAHLQGVTDGPVVHALRHVLLSLDGGDHTRLRKLVDRAFTPRAIEHHRPAMRAALASLLDPVVEAGRCEFVADVAGHYPLQVLTHVLGVPQQDLDEFATWVKAIGWAVSLELAEHRREAERGILQLDGYLRGLVDERRRNPHDDLVSALVAAEEDGDRLSATEVRVMVEGLLVAGYDTTRHQLALAMALFADHPDQWDLLAERPDLAPRAVDEVLRVHGTAWAVPRIAAQDLVVDGYHVPAGTFLLLSTAAANHDPAAHDRPHRFDITAGRGPHLAFGGGPHHCLGADLARAELEEALTLLPHRMPGLALDGAVTWRPPLGLLGPDSLPLRVQPPPRRTGPGR